MSTRACRAAGPLAGLAFLLVARCAAAAPARHVTLEWSQGDPTCIGAPELAALVERTIGRPVFHPVAPSSATVAGTVGKSGAGPFEAHVVLKNNDGGTLVERAVTTPGECARLDESIAVVITLMIDGLEDAAATLQIPESPPRPPAPALPPPPPEPRPAPVALAFGLGAGLSSSLLPGVAPSFDVRGEVAPRGFVPLSLTLRVHPDESAVVAGVGGRFSAWTAELAACPAWSNQRLRFGGCAGLGGGGLDGSYVNLSDGQSHVRPIVLAALGPFGSVRLGGPLWARAGVGAWIPLLRERWGYVDASGTFVPVFQPAPVVPTATLTLEVRVGS